MNACLFAEVDVLAQPSDLGDVPKRYLTPTAALAIVPERTRKRMSRGRGFLLQLGDLPQLLSECLNIALAFLSELFNELLLLREFFAERTDGSFEVLLLFVITLYYLQPNSVAVYKWLQAIVPAVMLLAFFAGVRLRRRSAAQATLPPAGSVG